MSPAQELLLGQGAYYALAGLWPVAHLKSFLRVTGYKHDLWLVKTVGLLVAVIGASLITAGTRGAPTVPAPETLVLAGASAAALGCVELFYGLRGDIRAVYLLDAIAEGLLLWFWATLVLWP